MRERKMEDYISNDGNDNEEGFEFNHNSGLDLLC
jgi:hypothetical protein